MAKFDVQDRRSYREYDCPPCPPPKHDCQCESCAGPAIGAGVVAAGIAMALLGPVGLIAGPIVGGLAYAGCKDENNKKCGC